MFTFFQCIAESVAAKGLVSLAREIPFGSFLLDIASDAWKRLKGKKKDAEIRAEVQKMAQAAADEVKHAAAKAAREAFPKEPEKAIELELYLSQIPATIRQSLRRPEDPTGTTVPASFPLSRAEVLLPLLPPRVSRFRPGNPLPGRDGWFLKELLGTGGFGEVWLATQPPYDSISGAVKFCLNLTDQDRALIHEGELIDRVMRHGKHPNIVRLEGCNLACETPWLMYEYVSGGELVSLVAEWKDLPTSNRHGLAIDALKQVVGAVGHFHRLGVVHRDLKPANILVEGALAVEYDLADSAPRTSFQLKVADFGIGGVAATHELALDLRMNSTGARLATVARGAYTPTYASPQQKKGNLPDPRDDVFALGVIGYQLLLGDVTAERPGGKGWRRALELQGVRPALLNLLERCWDDDPSERPSDAGDLLALLERALVEKPVGVPVPPPIPLPKPPPKKIHSLDDDSTVDPPPKPPRTPERTPERKPPPPPPDPPRTPRDPFRTDRSEWPDWVRLGLWGLRDRSTAVIAVGVCLFLVIACLGVSIALAANRSWDEWPGVPLVGAFLFGLATWWCHTAIKWVDRNVEPIAIRHGGGNGLGIVAVVVGTLLLLTGIGVVAYLLSMGDTKPTTASKSTAKSTNGPSPGPTPTPEPTKPDKVPNGPDPATATAPEWIVGKWMTFDGKGCIDPTYRFGPKGTATRTWGVNTDATGTFQATETTLTLTWNNGAPPEVWNRVSHKDGSTSMERRDPKGQLLELQKIDNTWKK